QAQFALWIQRFLDLTPRRFRGLGSEGLCGIVADETSSRPIELKLSSHESLHLGSLGKGLPICYRIASCLQLHRRGAKRRHHLIVWSRQQQTRRVGRVARPIAIEVIGYMSHDIAD